MTLAAEFVARPARDPRPDGLLRALALEPRLVLAALGTADGSTLRGLARRTVLTPHRTADALSVLACVGFAERETDAVWLTASGRHALGL